MKLLAAFLQLIRWPNLVFIALTQVLFNFGVVHPLLHQFGLQPNLSLVDFILLVIASVFIAAAGYIINDYFDVNIDLINKPDRMVIGKKINRRWALFWHLFLSLLGLMLSVMVSISLKDKFLFIGFANLLSIMMLWVYSTTYKRKILVGNILISLLTAWSVLVIYFAEIPNWWESASNLRGNYMLALVKLFRIAALYGGFAFIISLVREVVKDLEDMEGDRKEGCRTMPIVWGVPTSKVFAAVWLVVLLGTLAIIQIYALTLGWWLSAIYILIAVLLPLIFIVKKLYEAQNKADFAMLSGLIKTVMLTGILSMIFFKYYF